MANFIQRSAVCFVQHSRGVIRVLIGASAFGCLAVVSALSQGGDAPRTVVATLLLSAAETTDPAVQKDKYLAVTASGVSGFQQAQSWLYFDASALPGDIDLIDVRLQLTPMSGASSGMAITVAPAKVKAPAEISKPLSYSPSDGEEMTRLVSSPLPTGEELQLRSDAASLARGNLLVDPGQDRPRYIGVLLLPQGNSSRRVYYGLNSKDRAGQENHPGRRPRLIITYRRKISTLPACASEPSTLATIQSDGRPGAASSCNFVPRTDNHLSSEYTLRPLKVAVDTRTRAQVVYRDRLYVVRKKGSHTLLEELSPLGSLIASVNLDGEVRPGSPMVVDAFGRLRILTNDAIFTAQLKSNGNDLPASVDKKSFAFGQTPALVVPGPDGTLYIVDKGIFALNPEVGELDKNGKVVHPEELWRVAISDEVSARITLSPDGQFLYALAKFAGKKSEFVAINAQTGKDVTLRPDKAGKAFPDDLNSFRNPVVARGLKGVDFVYITGNSGSGATLWAVRNDPVTQSGDFLARLTAVWKYPLEQKTVVGQPILDPTVPALSEGLTKKKLYFVQGLSGGSGTPQLTVVSAIDGTKVAETPEPAAPAGKWSTEANPVADSGGNVMFWANNHLYGFTAGGKSLFSASVKSPSSHLSFGPGGTLYAAEPTADTGSTVVALIPSFQQNDAGPANVYSPTQLYMTGDPARKVVKSWVLGARGNVVLGENFSVKMGESLTVRVNASQ
jgi:hypothetical protein